MKENTGFICDHCYSEVPPHRHGSYRNHCPFCLSSKHLDIKPGDRASDCQQLMKAVGYRIHSKKGLQILHKCVGCGHEQFNIVDETLDDYNRILKLTNQHP